MPVSRFWWLCEQISKEIKQQEKEMKKQRRKHGNIIK